VSACPVLRRGTTREHQVLSATFSFDLILLPSFVCFFYWDLLLCRAAVFGSLFGRDCCERAERADAELLDKRWIQFRYAWTEWWNDLSLIQVQLKMNTINDRERERESDICPRPVQYGGFSDMAAAWRLSLSQSWELLRFGGAWFNLFPQHFQQQLNVIAHNSMSTRSLTDIKTTDFY
jgi:hypothetical protein